MNDDDIPEREHRPVNGSGIVYAAILGLALWCAVLTVWMSIRGGA